MVKRQEETRRVQFTPQGVTLLFETETETRLLGTILLRRGKITRTQLDKTLELQKTTKRRLGELLVQMGMARADEVNEALAQQLGEELFDLLTWDGASFDFKEGAVETEVTPTAPGTGGRRYESTPLFEVGSILMEAARRADEWKRIHGVLTSTKTLLIRRTQEWTDNGEFENAALARQIWDILDGTQNLEDVMQRTAFSRFQVFHGAHELHRAGLLKLIEPAELLEKAEETLVAGKTEYGLGLLAKACEGLEKRPELQVQAGQLYFWANRDEEARTILDEALRELLEQGQLEVALKFLESLRKQYPERTYPLERLVRIYGEVPDFESARQVGTELLSRYQEKHEQEKTHRLLKFLCEIPIKSDQSRSALAKLLVSFGEPRLASQQYELLGKQAQKSGRRNDAVTYYREALHLDPSRTESQRRLTRLTVAPRTKTKKLIKRLVAAGLLLAAMGAIAAGMHNEMRSRHDWAETRQRVHELVDARDFDDARRVCQDFLNHTMLTTTVEQAKRELQAVDSARNGYQSRCTQMDRALWTSAVRLEGAGDYQAAVKGYEDVMAKASQSSMAEKARERVEELQRQRERFEELVSDGVKGESEHNYAGAMAGYLEAAKLDPSEWRRRGLTLPVEVTSTPTNAEIWRDGKLIGHTPSVLRRAVTEELTLTIQEKGYLPGKVKVSTEADSARVHMELVQTRLPRWTHSLDGEVDVPVDMEGANVFVSSRSGQVTALETATGQVLWKAKLGTLHGSYVSQTVRLGQWLYVVLGDGRVTRLSADDGKESWSSDLHTLLIGTPVIGSPDEIVVAGAQGNVFGLGTNAGEVKWVVQTGEQTSWVVSTGDGSVCVGPTSVRYVASAQGGEGKPWRRNLEIEVSARPTVAEGRIYLPAKNGELMILESRSGSLAGSYDVSTSALVSPAISQRTVVATDVNGTVTALDGVTGKKLWEKRLGETVSSGGSCYQGTFYIGTDRGSLIALDVATGNVKWHATLDGAVQSAPVVTGQLCLAATRNGTVYAMTLK